MQNSYHSESMHYIPVSSFYKQKSKRIQRIEIDTSIWKPNNWENTKETLGPQKTQSCYPLNPPKTNINHILSKSLKKNKIQINQNHRIIFQFLHFAGIFNHTYIILVFNSQENKKFKPPDSLLSFPISSLYKQKKNKRYIINAINTEYLKTQQQKNTKGIHRVHKNTIS